MNDIIQINDIEYLNLFHEFSLNIKEEEYYCISGPNNCGKTTLIRILNKEIQDDFSIEINHKNIKDYKIQDYNKLIQTIFPLEIDFMENTLEEELLLYKSKNSTFFQELIKKLKLSKLLSKKTKELTDKEIVVAQIIISILNEPKILLIDSIDSFFSKQENISIHKFIKDITKEHHITVIEATTNLEDSLYADTLGIIQNGKVVLEGIPKQILKKDNVINKIGLRLPFMVDLSVKLKDYDLIEDLELEKDRMVDILWK